MNFLVTGAAGTVGRDLAAALAAKGHAVRTLDKRAVALPGVETLQGSLEDAPLVRRALEGVEQVIHLAWSFSDAPLELVQHDLKGHVVLLEACAAAKAARLFYASTAVVYGKPPPPPVTEDSPCLVEDARKPFYAVAKLAAEKLALAYGRTAGLPVTVIRFWWSYGDKIGGRHLRDLLALAERGEPLQVPGGAGGSFLDHEDLARALLAAGREEASIGQVFNLATVYLEWPEIARMILRVTASSSRLDVVPAREWRGAQFLAERWELSTRKAERLFGYRSAFFPVTARRRLEQAIARYRDELRTRPGEAVAAPPA
jgi:UDP-glucose 4-epimerase